MSGSLTRATALAAVGVMCVSGCSQSAQTREPVSRAELQKALVDKLAKDGTPSTWVKCPKDLAGTVGAMTRCDVKFSSDNTVTAVLTTTEVSGDHVTWEITRPELTKDQLAERVAGLTSAQSATCDSGFDGGKGEWVQCRTTSNGVTNVQVVEVKDTRGLMLDLTITTVIPKQEIEDAVAARVTPLYGRTPDSVQCKGGLHRTVGEVSRCVVKSGESRDTYLVTVTGVSPEAVDFDVTRKP